MKKKKKRELTLSEVEQLNKIGQPWRRDVSFVIVKPIQKAFRSAEQQVNAFAKKYGHWRRPANTGMALSYFGADRADSAYRVPCLDWSVKLDEPDITRTIARVLQAGPTAYRRRNVRAFLLALGVEENFLEGDLAQCTIQAERLINKKGVTSGPRIDIEFCWRDACNIDRLVVVEAKLNAPLTTTQLSTYYRAHHVKRARGHNGLKTIVLGLRPSVMDRVHATQRRLWSFCSWRDLLLRYEKLRPEGASETSLIYLHTLWRRVGRLTQEATHARL